MTNILTLRLDPPSQARFDQLRKQHYPPQLNQIAAHVTLFHTLPDTLQIAATLHRQASTHTPFQLQVTGLRSLGRGVAYKIASIELEAFHAALAQAFADHLTPQDRQRFQPHVVIQNKSTPELARALLTQLECDFQPFAIEALGLDLWHYLGGPWQHAKTFLFAVDPLA